MATSFDFENSNNGSTKLLYNDTSANDYVVELPKKNCTLAGTNDVIGVGQTWQNVTGRAFSTVYTNTYGRPIFVSVNVSSTLASNFAFYVNEQEICTTTASTAGHIVNISSIVPAGMTYQIGLGAGVGTISKWTELR